jgi:DNA-binding transcriptional MerR regulator
VNAHSAQRRYVLVKADRLSTESFADATGLHPSVVRQLVALGLVEADRDSRGELMFPVSQVGVVARIQRLRRGLGLNYAGVGAVLVLLDRIAGLEQQLRLGQRPPEQD